MSDNPNYWFVATAQINVRPKATHKATIDSVEFALELSPSLNEDDYLRDDGRLSAEGSRAAFNCFIQGLSAVIKYAHEQGQFDEVKMLKIAHAELDRAFFDANSEIVQPPSAP